VSWSICAKSMPVAWCLLPSAHDENRQAEKEETAADKEDGKKKKGGVQVPAEWPWEEARKIFEEPDVTPADQIDVGLSR
jgi:hypothetical protein